MNRLIKKNSSNPWRYNKEHLFIKVHRLYTHDIIVFVFFQQAYELYDGFVVLHGTDTLAYTASALSFMFENLGKTVVITGAQACIYYL